MASMEGILRINNIRVDQLGAQIKKNGDVNNDGKTTMKEAREYISHNLENVDNSTFLTIVDLISAQANLVTGMPQNVSETSYNEAMSQAEFSPDLFEDLARYADNNGKKNWQVEPEETSGLTGYAGVANPDLQAWYEQRTAKP